MITLLERWNSKSFMDKMILNELQFILNATQNGIDFFTFDENGNQIKYCVPYDEELAYGKKVGICYSEEAALSAIRYVLNEYAYMFLSWFRQGEDEFTFTLTLKEPVAYTLDENNAQEEVFDAMLVFDKCRNKAGFCVKSVVPILGYPEVENE